MRYFASCDLTRHDSKSSPTGIVAKPFQGAEDTAKDWNIGRREHVRRVSGQINRTVLACSRSGSF
jgi:hypothetical protein